MVKILVRFSKVSHNRITEDCVFWRKCRNCPVWMFRCLEIRLPARPSSRWQRVDTAAPNPLVPVNADQNRQEKIRAAPRLFIHMKTERPKGNVKAYLRVDTVVHFRDCVRDLRTHELLLVSIISAAAKASNTWCMGGEAWRAETPVSQSRKKRICDKIAGQSLPLWCQQVGEKNVDSSHETGQLCGAPRKRPEYTGGCITVSVQSEDVPASFILSQTDWRDLGHLIWTVCHLFPNIHIWKNN